MESNNPQPTKSTGKRFIIENRTKKLIRTDKEQNAQRKRTELMAAKEPWFTYTDTEAQLQAIYTLVNNNYRVTNKELSETKTKIK